MFYTPIFSFIVSLGPNCYDYTRFLVCLRLIYVSRLVHLSELVFYRSEPVQLGEPVWTPEIQSFIYRGVYYFTKPSEKTI